MPTSYDDAVCQLYRSAHDAFVAERKRLASELKAAGDKAGAARLSKLTRPPISAWAVNQLWWQAREPFEQLLRAAERLRAGDRGGESERRDALATLKSRAAALLVEAGHAVSEGTLRRVTTTLSALAAAGGFDPDLPGTLSSDRDPPGFDAAGLGAFGVAAAAPLGRDVPASSAGADGAAGASAGPGAVAGTSAAGPAAQTPARAPAAPSAAPPPASVPTIFGTSPEPPEPHPDREQAQRERRESAQREERQRAEREKNEQAQREKREQAEREQAERKRLQREREERELNERLRAEQRRLEVERAARRAERERLQASLPALRADLDRREREVERLRAELARVQTLAQSARTAIEEAQKRLAELAADG